MKQVNFDATGEKISEFCLGTMLMGTVIDSKASFAVLDHFTESGGNLLDTANCYAWWMGKGEFIGDESELIVGQWLQERKNRDKVFLATKVGARLKDPLHIRNADGIPEWDRVVKEYEGLRAPVIRKGVEDSLRRLKTDYIDLYYTHVYDPNTPIEETLEVMSTLVREGKVRHIGCSNLTTEQLQEARRISDSCGIAAFSALQQEYSYLHPKKDVDAGVIIHADQEMLNYATNSDMTFFAYSPLLKGIYNDEEKRKRYYNWGLFDSEENQRKLKVVASLSAELGITGNQLVLAWMRRHNPKLIPIIGFSNTAQYHENIKAIEIDLTDDQIARMNWLP